MTTIEATPQTPQKPPQKPWTQRTVEAITDRLSRTRFTRRNFLGKTALVGSALAIDATGFLFKPQSAHASVCGASNECNQGWSAFCATINNGANTCPPGSYTAGWWKIDNSAFCSGAARYIVDCNRSPSASCSCSCADGRCDRRRVCCNNFRYGQCNTQIKGTTPVVCRVVLCTPPWQFDPACTRTSLTDNQTRTHWSSSLPSRTNPTPIKVRWTEMGLTGSVLGDIVREESGNRGGRWAIFDNGVMTQRRGAPHFMTGTHVEEFRDQRGADGPLGYLLRDVTGSPTVVRYDNGSTYRIQRQVRSLYGPVDDYYRSQGERDGWMGWVTESARTRPGPWVWAQTSSGWHILHNSDKGGTKALRTTIGIDRDGDWPDTARVVRKSGANPYRTSISVSRETHPNGADTVIVATNIHHRHILGVGALAARLDAPVLLSQQHHLPPLTAQEIRRLGARRAIVIGPGSDILPKVAAEIRQLVDSVERYGSDNHIRSNVEISQGGWASADHVIVTTADDYRLALTGSALAAQVGGPMLATYPERLSSQIADEVQRLGATRATVLGNISTVDIQVIRDLRNLGVDTERIGGSSEIDTTTHIANRISSARAVVTDPNYSRTLMTAAALSVHEGMPLLLIGRDSIPDHTDEWLLDRRPAVIKVVGDARDVSSEMATALRGYPT